MYKDALPVYVPLYTMSGPLELVTDGFEPSYGCRDFNPDSLEEQPALLPLSHLSSLRHKHFFWCLGRKDKSRMQTSNL